MNKWFSDFIQDARRRADAAGLRWNVHVGADGRIPKDQRWDLTALVRSPPPRVLLSDLGTYANCLQPLNARRAGALRAIDRRPLGCDWQALIKAAVLDQLLFRGNQPHSMTTNVLTPLRILGTCAVDAEPWDLAPEHIGLACDVASATWASGKYAELIRGLVRDLIDRNHLADRSPLASPAAFRAKRARDDRGDQTPLRRGWRTRRRR